MRCRAGEGSARRCGSSCAISRCVRGGGKACMGDPRGYAGACRAFAGSVDAVASAHGVTGPSLGSVIPGSSVGRLMADPGDPEDGVGGGDDGGDGEVERVWPGSWARQGRRVITTADCLSLLGLDHTDGGPEVKRRTDRPLPEVTHSRQVASGCPALGAYAYGPRALGRAGGRADGAGRAVTRLTGPDGFRPTPLLSSIVLPAPGPGAFRGREPGRTPTASSSHAGALPPARSAARRYAGLHR